MALGDRRGTWQHPPSFHVAGVALAHIHIRFTWQAWHLRHWAGFGSAPGSPLTPWWHLVTSTFVSHLKISTFVPRGRRGTWSHPHLFHVAGVALTALGGLWWRTGFSADGVDAAAVCVAGVQWHLAKSSVTLRGRRGTWSHPHSFHVAGMALSALGELWWRTGFSADAFDATTLCVASVSLGHIHIHFALADIHLRFTWQAWQLVTSTFISRGKCGT